jgi:hypothetical protein
MKGKGKIKFVTFSRIKTFDDVLHVLGLSKNILLVGSILDNGPILFCLVLANVW